MELREAVGRALATMKGFNPDELAYGYRDVIDDRPDGVSEIFSGDNHCIWEIWAQDADAIIQILLAPGAAYVHNGHRITVTAEAQKGNKT